jgi:hypothetical protein
LWLFFFIITQPEIKTVHTLIITFHTKIERSYTFDN